MGIAQREIERLQDLIVDLEEIEGDDALELAEQASFCASEAAERLRRFQTARTRELLRTIDLLAKLRKADAPKPEKKATKEPNPPAAKKPAPRASSYRSDPIETLVAEGMTGYLAKLLEAGERPLRSPKTGANEPISERPSTLEIQARRASEGKRLGTVRQAGRGDLKSTLACAVGLVWGGPLQSDSEVL